MSEIRNLPRIVGRYENIPNPTWRDKRSVLANTIPLQQEHEHLILVCKKDLNDIRSIWKFAPRNLDIEFYAIEQLENAQDIAALLSSFNKKVCGTLSLREHLEVARMPTPGARKYVKDLILNKLFNR